MPLPQPLAGRRILLGVAAGIAAYKSPDLVRRLRDRGAQVRVVMTPAAQAFVGPLTFQAVSGEPVATDLLDSEAEAAMGHIELARWADMILVAPASADLIARLAAGMANDLLTTVALASACPLALAPAMNQQMWQHPATVANLQLLGSRGCLQFGPASGDQACGDVGFGRMLEPQQLVDAVASYWASKEQTGTGKLAGLRVLISAGPTYEDLDPVRYLGNRSSGRMGFAVAAAAQRAGAQVTLVAGPVRLDTPAGVERVDVRSAAQMSAEVMSRAPESDLFISAAAVADYRPAQVSEQKIKKGDSDGLTLTLVRNPDILKQVADLNGPFTVGFAAETEKLVEHARGKMRRKGIDMIAANRVGDRERGFDAPQNALTVIWEQSSLELELQSKETLAQSLIDVIAQRYAEQRHHLAEDS